MSLILSLFALVLTGEPELPPEHVRLTCSPGPIQRTYGGGPWKVMGCSDGKTLVMVSADSPSNFPFRYIIQFENGRSLVMGSGVAGDNTNIAAATQELKHLSASDFADLIEATEVQGSNPRNHRKR